ncbi:hypothetical protein L9F63_006706, partial [Diploptera punctata]
VANTRSVTWGYNNCSNMSSYTGPMCGFCVFVNTIQHFNCECLSSGMHFLHSLS